MRSGLFVTTVAAFVTASAAVQHQDADRQVIRTRADLVRTDATVRDRAGRFVPDLTRDDFEVFEDGVRQEIVSLVLSNGGRIFSDSVSPPPKQEGIVLPPAAPRAEGRIFVIFVDDLHMEPAETPRIREIFRSIARELVHDGDLFAMVSTGTSSIEVNLTYDRRRLDEAIGRVMAGGLSPREIISTRSGQDGPPEVRHRAHVAFRTAHDMVTQLEQVRDRRKAFIYVSNGYDLNPYPGERAKAEAESRAGYGADRDVDPFQNTGGAFAEADLAAQLGELTRAANRANATIYTIDPRGLVAGPPINEQVDTVEWRRHVAATQSTLRVLADLTGGFAIVDRNDITSGLKRIDAETSDYYVLGYYSSNPDQSRRRRHIDVRVKRAGVEVRARTEYVIPPARR